MSTEDIQAGDHVSVNDTKGIVKVVYGESAVVKFHDDHETEGTVVYYGDMKKLPPILTREQEEVRMLISRLAEKQKMLDCEVYNRVYRYSRSIVAEMQETLGRLERAITVVMRKKNQS